MREIKFKFWDKHLKKMCERKPYYNDFNHKNIIPLEFTSLFDKNEKEIYEGDIISDITDTDEGKIQSNCQVFWNKFTGSWHLDLSFEQDKTYSTELWEELNDFEYEITGNIYENKKQNP